jgi:hypothetical protein
MALSPSVRRCEDFPFWTEQKTVSHHPSTHYRDEGQTINPVVVDIAQPRSGGSTHTSHYPEVDRELGLGCYGTLKRGHKAAEVDRKVVVEAGST